MKKIGFFLLALIAGLSASFVYLNRALPMVIEPADFTCWSKEDGYFLEEQVPIKTIYGVGLAYAKHINETASAFDPQTGPPVFKKAVSSITGNQSVIAIPTSLDLRNAMNRFETGLAEHLKQKIGVQQSAELSALLDYEVELAFVLLESVSVAQLNDPDFVPAMGFMIANDVSARTLAILGEGQENRYDYWGLSKSFAGFTPLSEGIWVPHKPASDGLPCVTLETRVNGELRQHDVTDNLIYRPKEMLYFIKQRYPDATLQRGDLILTGTPGGVIFNIPRWKSRLAELFAMDRFQKLAISLQADNAERFLKPGDQVKVSGQWLGEVTNTLH